VGKLAGGSHRWRAFVFVLPPFAIATRKNDAQRTAYSRFFSDMKNSMG
jgi:hypothetical protein